MKRRVRVKFCGITRAEDALAGTALGADALGFVFYPPSPRYLEPEAAARIMRELPPFVTTVGLFVNVEPEEIRAIAAVCRFDLVQYHGDESDQRCREAGLPYIKAVRVGPETDLNAELAAYPGAAAILLDTLVAGEPGGTGTVFDWRQIPAARPRPLILAGGLHPANVAAAIAAVQPYGVDVSGGIEQGKGIKDKEKMQLFINEVDLERES